MRTTIDLSKPFPFTYPWIMWPGIAIVFPFVWIVTAFIQDRQHKQFEAVSRRSLSVASDKVRRYTWHR